MKRLMMFLMFWTGLITAVYIWDAATLLWNAPTTYTNDSNIISTDPVNLIDHPYTGPTASGPWTSYPYTAYPNAILPDPVAGETLWYTNEADLRGLRSGKERL